MVNAARRIRILSRRLYQLDIPVRSKMILKVLESAVANAVNNNKLDESKLYVSEARVDASPVMKRIMFDSRGYIGHKDKRTSHIVVSVMER